MKKCARGRSELGRIAKAQMASLSSFGNRGKGWKVLDPMSKDVDSLKTVSWGDILMVSGDELSMRAEVGEDERLTRPRTGADWINAV